METRKTLVRREGDTLLVQVKIQTPKLSKSGKTLVVGTTHGPFTTNIEFDGQPIVVNLNAFVYVDEEAKPGKKAKTLERENARPSKRHASISGSH